MGIVFWVVDIDPVFRQISTDVMTGHGISSPRRAGSSMRPMLMFRFAFTANGGPSPRRDHSPRMQHGLAIKVTIALFC